MLKKVQNPKDVVGCRGARAAEWGAELIASALALGRGLALAPESGDGRKVGQDARARGGAQVGYREGGEIPPKAFNI